MYKYVKLVFSVFCSTLLMQYKVNLIRVSGTILLFNQLMQLRMLNKIFFKLAGLLSNFSVNMTIVFFKN
jgi:hypothetical protein